MNSPFTYEEAEAVTYEEAHEVAHAKVAEGHQHQAILVGRGQPPGFGRWRL